MGIAASSGVTKRVQEAIQQDDVATLIAEIHARPHAVAIDHSQYMHMMARVGVAESLAEDLWALCLSSNDDSRNMITSQDVLTAVALAVPDSLDNKLVHFCHIFSPHPAATNDAALMELHYDDCYICTYTVLRILLVAMGNAAAADAIEVERITEKITDDVFVTARKTVEQNLTVHDLQEWAKARRVSQPHTMSIRSLHDLNSLLPLGAKFHTLH